MRENGLRGIFKINTGSVRLDMTGGRREKVFSAKNSGARGGRRGVDQISNSVRGADPSELTLVRVNNEIPFCKVDQLKQKEEIERLLLKNRISYYIKWEEQTFFKRLFDSEFKEKTIFTICIHETAVEKAKELVADMQDVKLLVP